MNKTTTQINKTTFSEWITMLSVFLMVFGFLFNRVVLSIGMIILLLHALDPKKVKYNLHIFKNNGYALVCCLFFFSFFISGLWSADKNAWWHDVQVKLPFVLLPFSMLSAVLYTEQMKKRIIYIVLSLLWLGILYSLVLTVNDPSSFFAGRHMAGPVTGDYLRFTLALVLGINLALYLLIKKKRELARVEIYILVFGILLSVIYIHLQAAKLGLLAYYALFFYYLVFYFFKRAGFLKSIALLIATGIIFVLALQLPAFNYQVERAQKEKASLVSNGAEELGGSFTARVYSYKAGFNLIKAYPLLGVGSGDLVLEMKNVYKRVFPKTNYELVPHNQFIFSMVAIGIPLSLSFWLLILFPLFKRVEVFEVATVLTMLCGTMVEAMLQVQFGVFVYLFFTLFWIATKQKPQPAG